MGIESKNNIDRLTDTLNKVFNGAPWYGISVAKKLRHIDWEVVNIMPNGYSKSIATVVKHMVNWRVFALNKLRGDIDFDIEIDSAQDWPRITITSEVEWQELKSELWKTQEGLITALANSDRGFLKKLVPGRAYDFEYLIEGIVQHDIYHLGQIGTIYAMVK